jgi:hypothetical protein
MNPTNISLSKAQDENEEPPATQSKASSTQQDKAPNYTLPHLV